MAMEAIAAVEQAEAAAARLKAETAQEWAELMLLRVVPRLPGNHDNLSLITVMLK